MREKAIERMLAGVSDPTPILEEGSKNDKGEAESTQQKMVGVNDRYVEEAAGVKIRAQRRGGELLKESEKNKGVQLTGSTDGLGGFIV